MNSLRNQGSADPLDDTADIMDGYGHGTGMAASIAGNGVGIGVAQKASIVEVLYTRGVGFVVPPGTLPGNIAEAWAWAIDDVITKGRRGRAVFMYAAGKTAQSDLLYGNELMLIRCRLPRPLKE